MSDSLSKFFSHLKNAQTHRILIIEHPSSKIILSILEILQECGYIRGFRSHPSLLDNSPVLAHTESQSPILQKKQLLHSPRKKNNSTIEILLKYKNQQPAINKIIRISKPSKRIYFSVGQTINVGESKNKKPLKSNANFSPLRFMKGILILSTSQGIMSDVTANRLNLGGEVLCHIS